MDALVHSSQEYFAPGQMDTFAWSKGTTPPWQGQGNAVSNDLSVGEMLEAAELDWEVEKRPLFVKRGEGFVTVPNRCELARKSDDSILSIVGSNWHPVQNYEAFDFFKQFVEAGHMNMEAAGSMWGGRYIWALARVDKDFVVGPTKGGDQIGNYILLCSPHLLGKSTFLQFCSMRFFCWNTMTFDLGAQLNSASMEFRVPHSRVFDEEAKEQAAFAMGLAVEQSERLKEVSNKLAGTRAAPEAVEGFFTELLKFDPVEAERQRTKGETIRTPSMLLKFREALDQAPGQDSLSARGTWWGAVNAVTAVVDHQQGRNRGTALRSAWLGRGAAMKRAAINLALEKAA